MADQNMEEESDSGISNSYSFKRCNSNNSLQGVTSSANNTTDDEDSDMGNHLFIKDRRREAHTQAEQKRRDAIKRGYEYLQELVPMCQNADNNQNLKLSKATVLQKTVDYIHYLQNCKRKQEEEVGSLRKEMMAMTIMKLNYDQILSAHQNHHGSSSRQVSDDVKFEVFRVLIDSLYKTFEQFVNTKSFAEISGSIIHWVEECCQPQILHEIMSGILQQLQLHDYATAHDSSALPAMNAASVSSASNVLAPEDIGNMISSTVSASSFNLSDVKTSPTGYSS